MLFDYDCFLDSARLCLAIPHGNLIITYPFSSYFSNLSYSFFHSYLAEELIDALLTMKGKLSKEGKRHLDDAR